MYTIVVFDDIAEEAEELRAQLVRHPQAGHFDIHMAYSEDDLKRLTSESVVADVLFADIVLPDGPRSGIDLVAEGVFGVAGPHTQTIFFSGYLEKALDTYAVPHVYFLLKPVESGRLFEAVNRALEALEAQAGEMIALRENGHEVILAPGDIVFAESKLRKLAVHTKHESIETYAKLDDLQDKLPSRFLRCHKSYLVNMECIVAFHDDVIVMEGDQHIPISQRRRKEAMLKYLEYLKAGR